jgi:hypothetical protein
MNPDDDYLGDEPEDDEMDLADIRRQKELDREDWQAETLRQRQECEE